MLKKVISTILSLSVIMSVCSLPASAWAPTAFENPKCMDLSELGNERDYISLPEEGKKKVCGCKKCTVDAVTYSQLERYINVQRTNLERLDRNIVENNIHANNWSAAKWGIFDLVLIPANLKLFNKIPGGKVPLAIIMSAGTIVGLIFAGVSHHYEILAFENKIRQENIYIALQQLARDIEGKRYENRNFLLVSTSYDPNFSDSIAQFAKKDGITYEVNYDEAFFNKFKDEKLKPLILDYEKGAFNTYEKVQYDTTVRDWLEKGFYFTLKVDAVIEGYRLYKKFAPIISEEIINSTDPFLKLAGGVKQKIEEFMKKYGISKKQLVVLFKFIADATKDSESEFKKVINMGANSISILFDDEIDKDKKNDNKDSKSNNDKTDQKQDATTNSTTKSKSSETKSDVSIQTDTASPLKGQDDKSKVKMPHLNIDSSAPKSASAA